MYNRITGKTNLIEWWRRFRRDWQEHGFDTARDWYVWSITRSGGVVIGLDPYSNHPMIRCTVYPLHQTILAVQDATRWIRYRTVRSHMHHVVFTNLDPGWWDKDEVMLHACFKLLVDFVEKEYDGAAKLALHAAELAETEHPATADQYTNQLEILALYRWWTVEHPAVLKSKDEELMQACEAYTKLVEKIARDEQTMLHRLIDVRCSLWT